VYRAGRNLSPLSLKKKASGRDEGAASLAALTPELRIRRLEVNDLNFEFVFPELVRQDGSGEIGCETLV
jgi:hypothetical protein